MTYATIRVSVDERGVAAPQPAGAGERSSLGDTHQLHCEVSIGGLCVAHGRPI